MTIKVPIGETAHFIGTTVLEGVCTDQMNGGFYYICLIVDHVYNLFAVTAYYHIKCKK